MDLSGTLATLNRRQTIAVTATIWAVSTAVTGWFLGDYASAALGTATGVGVFALLYSAVQGREFNSRSDVFRWLVDFRRPTRHDVAVVVLVIAIGIVSRLTLGTVYSLLAPAAERGVHRSVAASEPSLAYLILLISFAVVFGPIFEELVFRNGLQKFLAIHTGWPGAIVATSALFTVFHIPSYGGFGAPVSALALPIGVVFVDSMLYGVAYWRTRNIAVAMAAHGGSNAMAVLSYAL